MRRLPEDAERYQETQRHTGIPKGLARDHRTRDGTWAVVKVVRGSVRLVFDIDPVEAHVLTPEHDGVIEPRVTHHLEAIGPVEFYVEFHRRGPVV